MKANARPYAGEPVRTGKTDEYPDEFGRDILICKNADILPKQRLEDIRRLEKAVDCPNEYVSAGSGCEDYFLMK